MSLNNSKEPSDDEIVELSDSHIAARDFLEEQLVGQVPEIRPALLEEMELWDDDYRKGCGGHALIGAVLNPFIRNALEEGIRDQLDHVEHFLEIFSARAKCNQEIAEIWEVSVLEFLYDIDGTFEIDFLGPQAKGDYDRYREARMKFKPS